MTSLQAPLSLRQQNRTVLSAATAQLDYRRHMELAQTAAKTANPKLFWNVFFPSLFYHILSIYFLKTANGMLAKFSLIKQYAIDILQISFSSKILTYSRMLLPSICLHYECSFLSGGLMTWYLFNSKLKQLHDDICHSVCVLLRDHFSA